MKKLISLLLLGINCIAQTSKDPRGDQIILSVSNKSESNFTLFEPTILAKGVYSSISEAKNLTPEKVFEALLSETSFEWTKHNALGGEIKPKKDEYYAKMGSMDKQKNYYSLRCKWEFEVGGSQYAIVKFDFTNQENKKATGSYTLVKKGSRWYKHEKAYTSNINLLFIAFKDTILQDLMEGKANSNAVYSSLFNKVKSTSGIDLDVLFKEYESWQKGKDNDKINYFLDPTSWINQK